MRPRGMNELHYDWWRILKQAWSVRLMALAAFLSGLEVALPWMLESSPIAPGILAAITGVVTAAALVARIMI